MRLSENKIIKNASWIIICRVMQSVLSLIISMIAARYLGPGNFGLINYASSITAFVVPLVRLGLNSVLVQEIVSNPDDEGKILGTSMVMGCISSLLGVIGCTAFAFIVNRGEQDTLIVCFLYSISLFFQMMELIQYWYQANLLSKYTAVTSLVARFIISVYRIYIIIVGKTIYWFAIVNALDYFIIAVVLIVIYRRKSKNKLCFSTDYAKSLISKSKHYILSDMMVAVFGQTDKIMLKLFQGDEASGFYSAAIVCTGMTTFVFLAIIDSMRPVIFQAKKNSEEDFRKYMTMLFSIIFYLALTQSLFITVLSKPIVGIIYGPAYAPTVLVLAIITWYSAFSYTGPVRDIWILAENQQKYLWKINLSGAVLNIIGNLILIPYLGAVGAAIASVLTQVFTNFILCFTYKPIKPMGSIIVDAMNPKIILNLLKKLKM